MRNRIITFLVCLLVLGLCSVFARTYIVAVGINDYSKVQGADNLRLPVNDATDFAALFKRNNSATYTLLTDSRATRNNIVAAMKNVYSKAGKDDTIIFYFSGHGYHGGYLAYDGKLPYETVRKAMSRKGVKCKLVFADACHAGGMRADARRAAKAVDQAKKSDVVMFMASRNNEASIERSTMKNGLFTDCLLLGLRGKADTNRDRIITAKELFVFVHDGVIKMSRDKQHPVMWGNFNDSMPVMKW